MTWPIKKLGEVLDYEQPTKYLVSSTDYKDEFTTPVLTAGKTFILGNTNEKNGIFPKEKLPVIIFDDFTTATKFVDFSFKVKSSAMKILHAKKSIADTKYLFYLIQTIKFSHKQHKRYWISEYSQLEIPFPPIEEQKRIAVKIEKLFVKIDEASHLRKEASSATAAFLPSAVYHIFTDAKNWETVKIGKVVRLQGGFAFKSGEYESSGIPIVRIQNLQNEILDLDGAQCMPASRKNEFSDYLLHEGDLLIAMSGATTGKIAIVKNENLPALLNQRVGRFLIKDKTRITGEFLFWVVRIIQQKVFQGAFGAAQPNISGKSIEEIEIPLLSVDEQKKIVAYLDLISIKSNELQNIQRETAADFSALRQSILASAFAQ